MSCNIQKKTLDHFKKKGLIGDNRLVPTEKIDDFNAENEKLTQYAKDSKNVDLGPLFELKMTTIERSGNQGTLFKNRAIPNTKAFDAIEKYNNDNSSTFEKNIGYQLKAVDILSSEKAKQVFAKGKKNGWDLNKILTELQVPKEQKQIILDKYKGKVSEKEFIKSIFPDTKVKQIVYHGGTVKDIFTKENIGKSTINSNKNDFGQPNAFYFTTSLESSKTYGDVKSVILNIQKPEILNQSLEDIGFGPKRKNKFQDVQKLDLKNKDSFILKDIFDAKSLETLSTKELIDDKDGSKQLELNKKIESQHGDTIGVFKPEQIHILTKEDQAKIYNEDNLREEIITSLLAENSFVVEVNTTKKGKANSSNPEEYEEALEQMYGQSDPNETTSYYSNLTVPGGTNYTENEIATPDIIPNIKGHAQFSTDNGIGWFRGDDQVLNLSNLEDLGIIKKVPC